MKLTEKMISVLKNFAAINSSIALSKGNVVKTMDPLKTIVGIAKLDVEFPSEACIYDLTKFISVLSLYKDPDIEFESNHFVITEGNRKTNYTYAEKRLLILPPEKDIELPSEDVVVPLNWEDLETVVKAASKLQLPEIAISCSGESVYIRAINSEVPNADTFDIETNVNSSHEFNFILKSEKLKLIPQNYEVKISKAGLAKFEGEYVTYFIPCDKKSTFK